MNLKHTEALCNQFVCYETELNKEIDSYIYIYVQLNSGDK